MLSTVARCWVVLLCVATSGCNQVDVALVNQTASTIDSVNLVYRSGTVRFEEIRPASTVNAAFRPDAETGVVMVYAWEGGAPDSMNIDIYVVPGSTEKFTVVFRDGSTITVLDSTEVGIW